MTVPEALVAGLGQQSSCSIRSVQIRSMAGITMALKEYLVGSAAAPVQEGQLPITKKTIIVTCTGIVNAFNMIHWPVPLVLFSKLRCTDCYWTLECDEEGDRYVAISLVKATMGYQSWEGLLVEDRPDRTVTHRVRAARACQARGSTAQLQQQQQQAAARLGTTWFSDSKRAPARLGTMWLTSHGRISPQRC